MRTFFFVFFLYFSYGSFCSVITDSLETRLPNTVGTEKADVLVDLAYYYSSISFEKAYKYGSDALTYSNSIKYPAGIVKSYINLGITYICQNSYPRAEEYFSTAHKLSRDYKLPDLESRILNGLGVVCKSSGDFAGALDYYQQALKCEEKYGKPIGVAIIRNNMGNILKKWGKYDEAGEQFQLSIEQLRKEGNPKELSKSISNLGLLHKEEGKYSLALEKFDESLKIEVSLNDSSGIARSYCNLGDCYLAIGDFVKAEEFLKKSISIGKNINDKQLIILSQSSIASLYNKTGQINKALVYLQSSLELAEATNSLYEMEDIYFSFYKIYENNNQSTNALKYHILYTQIKDSIFSRENSDKLMELQTVYKTEKKDAEIQSQNLQIVQEKEISHRQQIITYISIGALIFVTILLVILLFQIRAKMKANKVLKLKNEEISMQKEEIQAQRDEIEAQRDQVQKQKEKIEIINKETTASISYAQLIQAAVLPSQETLSNCFSENFVFYLPKDIVSGDFFWIREIADHIVFAVADCTGHGVPGGFMSMLGISLLNEIVDENNKNAPDVILNRLRKQVILSLGQSGNHQKLGDGMDISICCINKTTMKLNYSGANNPVYIIPEKDISNPAFLPENSCIFNHNNRNLIELRPNKMPVGSHVSQDIPFSSSSIVLEKNDIVLLFTDGYVDQFGGQDKRKGGRKFMHKTLKNLLLEIATKPFSEQENDVISAFHEWKNYYEQTDDVLVMAVKL